MTLSKEYKEADPFKRYLLRQIHAGNALIKRGWYEHQKDKPNLCIPSTRYRHSCSSEE